LLIDCVICLRQTGYTFASVEYLHYQKCSVAMPDII